MENNNYIKINRSFIERYTRSNYRVVGKNKHSSIKPCYWMGQKLLTGRDNRNCYKAYFGIKSELCIQNTPSYPFCNHQCVFCWRDVEGTIDSKFTVKPDDPGYLAEEMIKHQKNLVKFHFSMEKSLQNFHISKNIVELLWKKEKVKTRIVSGEKGTARLTIIKLLNRLKGTKGNMDKAVLFLKNTDVLKTDDLASYYLSDIAMKFLNNSGGDVDGMLEKFVTSEKEIKEVHRRAMNPGHAAISLDGEPTLYPYIGEYVTEFRKRGMTTFIVTNGTKPEIIKRLNENGTLPTQLYITLPSPNKIVYRKVCRPKEHNTWEKILKTLSLVQDLKTRTCIRITAVKNLNIGLNADYERFIAGYVELIKNAQPDFLDIKGFTLEGSAMNISKRLGTKKKENYFFPDFKYLLKFAQGLEKAGDFEIIKTHEKSRDILLRVNWPKSKNIKITHKQI
ncbi:MAG: radical SAM protein [Promethearchaeota archaeon]